MPGSALITAGVASVIVAATNGAGILPVVPLLLAGATIDIVTGRMRTPYGSWRLEARYLAAALAAGVLLFVVSSRRALHRIGVGRQIARMPSAAPASASTSHSGTMEA